MKSQKASIATSKRKRNISTPSRFLDDEEIVPPPLKSLPPNKNKTNFSPSLNERPSKKDKEHDNVRLFSDLERTILKVKKTQLKKSVSVHKGARKVSLKEASDESKKQMKVRKVTGGTDSSDHESQEILQSSRQKIVSSKKKPSSGMKIAFKARQPKMSVLHACGSSSGIIKTVVQNDASFNKSRTTSIPLSTSSSQKKSCVRPMSVASLTSNKMRICPVILEDLYQHCKNQEVQTDGNGDITYKILDLDLNALNSEETIDSNKDTDELIQTMLFGQSINELKRRNSSVLKTKDITLPKPNISMETWTIAFHSS